jgi:hypothetical protein
MGVIIWEMWHAMADERVCGRCAALAGNLYRAGEGPHPPLHRFCRCRRVLAFRQEAEPVGDGGPVLDPFAPDPAPRPVPAEPAPGRPLPVPPIDWGEGRPPAMPRDPWMPLPGHEGEDE